MTDPIDWRTCPSCHRSVVALELDGQRYTPPCRTCRSRIVPQPVGVSGRDFFLAQIEANFLHMGTRSMRQWHHLAKTHGHAKTWEEAAQAIAWMTATARDEGATIHYPESLLPWASRFRAYRRACWRIALSSNAPGSCSSATPTATSSTMSPSTTSATTPDSTSSSAPSDPW